MRTHADALRSFKRALSLALDAGDPPLAAAKWYPDPAGFDAAGTYPSAGPDDFLAAFDVWYDLNPAGDLDAAPVADVSALVPMGSWAGFRFWGNPPGQRWDAGSEALSPAAPDDSAVSLGLVAGCSLVPAAAWAEVLSAPRWGLAPPLVDLGGGRGYRVAMLVDRPQDLTDADLSTPVALTDVPDPDVWDVRFAHDAGQLTYPGVIVKPVGGAALAWHALYCDVTQPFVVYAYPRGPGEEVDASSVQVEAEVVKGLLARALVQETGRNGARPGRLPLYDYDGVPLDQPAGRRLDTDYLRVMDASVESMPEPTDPRMAVVVADVRLNWRVSLEEARGKNVVKALLLDIGMS